MRYRKSNTGFSLVPKLVTLNDIEPHNAHYSALFRRVWYIGGTHCQVVGFRLDGSLFMYVRCCLLLVKILGVTCARYESRSKMCNVYYMFYVTSSATGDRLSYVCRGNDLTHFTRQLLDHRTTELVSQMRQTDEVYSVKQRRRRSSQSYSLAAEPLETIDPTLFGAPHNEQLRDYDGSGELTDNDRMPPAEEISEGVVDGSTLLSAAGSDDTGTMSQPHHTEMMPYGKVVHPRHSTTLRTFCLKYCHPSSHYYIVHTFICAAVCGFYQPIFMLVTFKIMRPKAKAVFGVWNRIFTDLFLEMLL